MKLLVETLSPIKPKKDEKKILQDSMIFIKV